MIYARERSVCTWEEYVFCYIWMECSVHVLGPFDLKSSSSPVFLYWFSVCITYSLLKVSIDVPHYYCVPVNFCIQINTLRCIHILDTTMMVHTYLQLLYFLNELTHLSYNDLLFLLLQFDLKSILAVISIAIAVLFSFSFAWNIFFHFLTVSLKHEWVSNRQHIVGAFWFFLSIQLLCIFWLENVINLHLN